MLNPRTRMLKLATDAERVYAHGLVRSEIAKIMETNQNESHSTMESQPIAQSMSSPSKKKFKSYTDQFDDDIEQPGIAKKSSILMRSRCEMETYFQIKLAINTSNDTSDDPLAFWKTNRDCLPNMCILAKRVFSVPASSAAVERTFSSAGVIISQRRTNINPAIVNDMILVRSASDRLKKDT